MMSLFKTNQTTKIINQCKLTHIYNMLHKIINKINQLSFNLHNIQTPSKTNQHINHNLSNFNHKFNISHKSLNTNHLLLKSNHNIKFNHKLLNFLNKFLHNKFLISNLFPNLNSLSYPKNKSSSQISNNSSRKTHCRPRTISKQINKNNNPLRES